MASLSKDLVLRLIGDSKSAEASLKAAADAAEVSVSAYRKAQREADKQAAAAAKAAAAQQEAMESVGQGAMIFGAVVAAGLALSTKAAIDWESAWAGVQKTVDGTPAEMADLEVALRKLATTLPATSTEIAAVAEAAGQLGIARGDILEFTEVSIAMGVSTNLSAEEAAVGMARMANIMGTAKSDVDRMGAALVALGNAGASTEGGILDMSLRIAAAGRQAGMTEGEVLGLANSMSSLGIEAEAGGTAISTVIKDINSSVLDGGKKLAAYADVAGVTAGEFAKAWRDDAASALVLVVEGLARMQAQGQNVNAVISDLGLDGIRTSDTLLRLAGDTDGLAASLTLGNKAWAENSALMNEANQRYETTASRLRIAGNQINDAAIDIGGLLLPALAAGADLVADFARGFADLPDGAKATVTTLGVLAATVGIVGGAAMIAVPKLIALRGTMTTLAASSGIASSAVGRFGLIMTGPWGAAIGVATLALGGLITWLGNSSRASEDAAGYQRDLASALRESGGAIDDNVQAMAAQKAADAKFQDSSLLKWAERIGVEGQRVTDALLGQKAAYEEIEAAIDSYAQKQLDAATAAGTADTLDLSWVSELKGQYADLAGGMGGAVAENERLAEAQGKTGQAALSSTAPLGAAAEATGDLADSGGQAADAAQRLVDALDALNGPTLNLRDATRGYQEQLDKTAEAMGADGWTRTLDENTEAGRANAQMLDDLATSAMEQANAIIASGGSYDAFRNSLDVGRAALIETAKEMGATEEEAQALADSILDIPDAASVDITIPTYRQVTSQLADVQTRIAGIPPKTTTNVGVISADAIASLERVGLKVTTLPDGTVDVYANDQAAIDRLNALVRTRWTATVTVNTQNGVRRGGGMMGGNILERADGGPVWPGEPFLVGERGPEIVQFGARGFVTPADQTARVLDAIRQPAAGASSPVLAQAAAGPAATGRAATSGSATLVFDYGRLAAELAGIADRRPTVGQLIVSRESTANEVVERLGWDAALGGGR